MENDFFTPSSPSQASNNSHDHSPTPPGHSSKLQISPGKTKYWIPHCSDDVKPYSGQMFTSLKEAIAYYKEYAAITGFDIRLATSSKARDGTLKLKYVVCSRQGFKNDGNIQTPQNGNGQTDQNVPLVDHSNQDEDSSPKKRCRVSNRCGCKARIVFKFCGLRGYSVFRFVERHNHAMSSTLAKPFLKVNRNLNLGHQKFIVNCTKANIGTMKCYRLFKESVGGYSNIGATAVDFKNFKRDLKAYIAGVDAQMLLDKLFRKKEVCSAFFFNYDVDENDQLRRLFWTDPVARVNYTMFGDVVSFDATYGTNRYNMVFAPFTGVDNHRKCVTFGAGLLLKEDVESYVWLFRQFLDAMGREPTSFVTDQDPSMKIAFTKVFTTASHRFCMWHIMEKVSSKVGPVLSKNSDFMSKLNSVVWSHYLEPEVFEEKWTSIMEEFGLENHVWFSSMYDIRTEWIPSYFRDLYMAGLLRTTSRSESENNFFGEFSNPHFSLVEFYMQFESAMDAQRHCNAKLNADSESYFPTYKTPLAIERNAAKVYTLSIFFDVQSEICSACFSCRITGLHEIEGTLEYLILDERGLKFNVRCSLDATNLACSCKYFLRLGLVCRHIFVVLKEFKFESIPSDMLNTRWFKKGFIKPFFDISDAVIEQSAALEEKKFVTNQLWSDIHSCVAMVENDPSLLRQFFTVIKQQKELIASTMQDAQTLTNKNSVIQSFFGATAPTSVTVLQPPQAHNKGSGKRIKGAKELAVSQSQRAKRLCRSCKQMSFHDSRNCPKNNLI